MGRLHVTLFCIVVVGYFTIFGNASQPCRTPQYLELGGTGLINCSFEEEPLRVLWYKTVKATSENLIMTLWDSVKEGGRYESVGFDILPNGSLQINNVSAVHDGNFIAVQFRSLEYDPERFVVLVITTVKPFTRHPLIKECRDGKTACLLQLQHISEVTCLMEEAKPPIALEWFSRTLNGEKNLSSNVTITHHGVTSTTVATTSQVFYSTSVLTFLVCKAQSLPGVLDHDETSILVEKRRSESFSLEIAQKFIERNSKFVLKCTENKINMIVWKRSYRPEDDLEPILYAALFDKSVSVTRFDSYELNLDGSLTVRRADVGHEGLFECAYESGVVGDRSLFNITIYVPQYPVVTGCNEYQYCALGAEKEGSITCSVKGVRPLVHLEIDTFNDGDASSIVFTDRDVVVNNNGDLFDEHITLKYRIEERVRDRITLECRIFAANTDVMTSRTQFDLLLSIDQAIENPREQATKWGFLWILVLIVPLGFSVGLIVVCILRGHDRRQFILNSEEKTQMMSLNDLQGKKAMLISELKTKYQDLYDAVQPIPYIRDRLYCVERVFVEGGIEYLVANDRIGGQKTWGKLSSYHSVLDDDRVKSIRRIIEGEPGYGKSTLTLQLSYDWCNKIGVSYLKGIDILILLRLRQLGGVTSIYRAIKQFLLPKDSKLKENDIADITGECSSVLVILDGYDEYPDQDGDVDSDIVSIIMRKMFQQFEVILTTRSSYLPRNMPAITKRLKLTGFDNDARSQYILKAVVGDDVAAAEKIKQRLKENPILGDLCQVPLFFVMFAHMSHESKQFQKFKSVTSFFRYMISCFHSHMKNKMEDDNVEKYDLFETEHRELDNLAFEGLSRKDQQIVWNKQYMCERLGKDFYDQYVRIGILVEEEVLDISDDSNAIITEHIQYKTEVRFYHKLFCEWYAAHHLSEYASKDDVTFDPTKGLGPESEIPVFEENSLNNDQEKDIDYESHFESEEDHYLKYLDPFDLQYVYRFACGLNRVAAGKIIENLKTMRGGEKFAILCILEKSGKVEDVLEDVKYLCSRQVKINDIDSLLLQRSTIQLLEIAIAHEISISCVWLDNCYSTVDLRGGNHLQLKSNLSIPVLTTLNKIVIDTGGEGREITSEEFTDILQYSSKCLALKELRFGGYLLPPAVQAESVSVLRSRNVKVIWAPIDVFIKYKLNLHSCQWENLTPFGTWVLSDEDYQTVVRKFRAKWQSA